MMRLYFYKYFELNSTFPENQSKHRHSNFHSSSTVDGTTSTVEGRVNIKFAKVYAPKRITQKNLIPFLIMKSAVFSLNFP